MSFSSYSLSRSFPSSSSKTRISSESSQIRIDLSCEDDMRVFPPCDIARTRIASEWPSSVWTLLNLFASHCRIFPSLPALQKSLSSSAAQNLTQVTLKRPYLKLIYNLFTYTSSCANIDLWQSPKSSPHILAVLSPDPVTISLLSYNCSA